MNESEISKELEAIKQRNIRVEAEKAWELSWTRRIFIGAVTYILAGIWLWLIHDSYPWLKAFIPAVGYLLSTFSLPIVKNWWMKKNI